MFAKILIANRGEIAVRLICACREAIHPGYVFLSESPDFAELRSVWAIDRGSDVPRFITAYPLKSGRSER